MKIAKIGNGDLIRILISVLLGLITLMGGSILCTQLVSTGKMEEGIIDIARWIILLLTGVITALSATGGRKEKRIGWICCGLIVAIMILCAVIGFGGFGLSLLIGAGVLMAGGAAVMIAAQKSRKKSPVGFKAYR